MSNLREIVAELQVSLQTLTTAIYVWIGLIVVAAIVFNIFMYRGSRLLKQAQEKVEQIRKDIECQNQNQ